MPQHVQRLTGRVASIALISTPLTFTLVLEKWDVRALKAFAKPLGWCSATGVGFGFGAATAARLGSSSSGGCARAGETALEAGILVLGELPSGCVQRTHERAGGG